MPERLANGRLEVRPGDLRDKYGLSKGEEITGLLESLTPQVAMWKMSKEPETGEGPLVTDSLAVSEFVRENYFLINTRFIASGILFLSFNYRSPVFDCGIEFMVPEGENAPPIEVLMKERYFLQIVYPTRSDKYRFWANLSPENLDMLKGVADSFGSNTNLHNFYADAVAFWVQETGLPYPTDSETPEVVKQKWEELERLESERLRKEAREDLQQTWDDTKRCFDETEDQVERGQATFDVVFALEHGIGFYFLPAKVTRLECQTERDNRLIYDCVEKARTLEEFIETVGQSIDQRLEAERDHRRTINEMWVEVQGLGENTGEMLSSLLEEYGLLRTTTQKEILWDQVWVIDEVARIYNSLEVKSEEDLRKGVSEHKFLKGQEVEDIVQFLSLAKPEYVSTLDDDEKF